MYTRNACSPPGCEDWWGNAARHDGFLACGAPFDATLDDLSFDFDGMSVITPSGSKLFVQDFLAAYVSKRERFLGAVKSILSMPHQASQASSVQTSYFGIALRSE